MAGTYAPEIEIELPSGDTITMTEEEFQSMMTLPRKKFVNMLETYSSNFNEMDVKAFKDYTSTKQEGEDKPIGANIPSYQGSKLANDQTRNSLIKAMDDGGIQDPQVRAAIAAVVEGESKFKPISEGEYTSTSPDNLRKIFKSKLGGKTDAQIAELKKDPVAFFNAVYDGVNGNEAGDGYKYRGRGLIQITGKGNYEKYGKMIGVDLVKNPELAKDPDIAAKLAVAYVKDRAGTDFTGKDVYSTVARAVGYSMDQTEGIKKGAFQTFLTTGEFNSKPQTATDGVMSSLVRYDNQNATRSQKLTPTLETNLSKAVADVYGPGYQISVYSGGQESNKPGEGTGTVRHNHGMAGDIRVLDPQGAVVTDTTELDKLKTYWSENKLGSVGTYMPDGGMHLDEWTQDKLLPGMGLTWNYGGKNG